MNSSNPFQIPVCLQRADSQQRRRERFKRGFIATVAAIVVLLIGALIEGCMSEQTANTAQTASVKVADLPTPSLNQPSAGSTATDTTSQPVVPPVHSPAVSPANENATVTGHSESVYVIKSGDTLTRIAKAHGTTVKAIKAANGLGNDRIVVGARLKIPEV